MGNDLVVTALLPIYLLLVFAAICEFLNNNE